MFDKPRSANPYANAIFSAACIALLGTEHPDDGLLASVSPARLVDAATPPMYLWSTSEDNQVPVQHTLLLALALADKGIPFEAHVFENGPHGLSLATQASSGAKSEINPSVAQWVGLCAAWLEKRFEFDLPKLNVWQRRHAEE
jgi:dipeptidyl aminopeptidase/acylaminoacyl peptidase